MAAHRVGRLSSVIAPDFAPSGIPDSLIHTVAGTNNIASRFKIPYRIRVKLGLDFFLMDNAFDLKARKLVGDADIFHGWSHQALFSMKAAHRRRMKTVVERPNMHPLEQARLVNAEYEKYGFGRKSQCPGELTKTIRELELADRVIVCSELAKQSHVENGIAPDKIRVINYGVDAEVFAPGTRKDDVFRVVYCGMVCLRKGAQYLLQAWKDLNLPDAELWLIGVVLAGCREADGGVSAPAGGEDGGARELPPRTGGVVSAGKCVCFSIGRGRIWLGGDGGDGLRCAGDRFG